METTMPPYHSTSSFPVGEYSRGLDFILSSSHFACRKFLPRQNSQRIKNSSSHQFLIYPRSEILATPQLPQRVFDTVWVRTGLYLLLLLLLG